MAIKSLNEICGRNGLLYRCNCCGDVNNPADRRDFGFYKPEDVMTQQEQDLYYNYWTEDGGCNMHVLRIEGKAAMGLCYLLDAGWVQDVVEQRDGMEKPVTEREIRQAWMSRMFAAAYHAAEDEIQKLVPGCDIYLGYWTDPDGHEMLVVVPYEMRDQIKEITDKLCDAVYDATKNNF